MALTGLVASINASVHVESEKVDGASSMQDTINLGRAVSLLFGTGVGKADQVWHDRREIANGADDDLDLSGVLKNAFGETITFSKIRAVLIINQSDVVWGTHTEATAAAIKIGGYGAGGWQGPFASNTELVYLEVGNIFLITNNGLIGWEITADDKFQIGNNDGSNKALYDIVIIGEE